MPSLYERDKALGSWVSTQRNLHTKNKLRQDRKELLDELGFVWKVESRAARMSKKWDDQHEKLVEFKRKNGHCIVPRPHEDDKAFGRWVNRQRCYHTKNIIRQDRKELLDELGFVWKAPDTLAARPSSTTDDVRYLVIRIILRFGQVLFLTLLLFMLDLSRIRIRIRKQSPSTVWVSQTKHRKKLNECKVTLETESNVHLPSTESDQESTLPKTDK